MRFAVIGTGAIVEKFISAGSQVPGFSLYAVYSRSKERGQALPPSTARSGALTTWRTWRRRKV